MAPRMDGIVSVVRRSRRLQALHSSDSSQEEDGAAATQCSAKTQVSSQKPQKKRRKKQDNQMAANKITDDAVDCLPRTLEIKLLAEISSLQFVMGIDEAGRGPLAGPVVAAAAIVPRDIAGIVDSKKVKHEETRERLYEEIVASPNVRWAAAIVDASKIDEINILQATLLAMRMAATAVMVKEPDDRVIEACVSQEGCYVVCGQRSLTDTIDFASGKRNELGAECVYALVDGNRLPKEMPCEAEFLIKGDSKEYSIAAASIIAKVTRDRLMNAYDELYPAFGLKRHKGYPTAKHMAAVREHGASPIHRRTFAPLKHMVFDKTWKVVVEDKSS